LKGKKKKVWVPNPENLEKEVIGKITSGYPEKITVKSEVVVERKFLENWHYLLLGLGKFFGKVADEHEEVEAYLEIGNDVIEIIIGELEKILKVKGELE
jgi:hypothetical protein